jgi:hypothetical protein
VQGHDFAPQTEDDRRSLHRVRSRARAQHNHAEKRARGRATTVRIGESVIIRVSSKDSYI